MKISRENLLTRLFYPLYTPSRVEVKGAEMSKREAEATENRDKTPTDTKETIKDRLEQTTGLIEETIQKNLEIENEPTLHLRP